MPIARSLIIPPLGARAAYANLQGMGASLHAPDAGLEDSAQALRDIYNGLLIVVTNRQACRQLARRCAAARESMTTTAGESTASKPLENTAGLLDALHAVLRAVRHSQTRRPFFRRGRYDAASARTLAAGDAALDGLLVVYSRGVHVQIVRATRDLAGKSVGAVRTGRVLRLADRVGYVQLRQQ
ncbi:hypothetical protein PLICRDRAFT_176796 [Plicaturopsis crispa FD-325 SS-3]|nr:hypothetical protein PLICRDRAFT_176796 [Plicaturopsis crispa FD-325 SS-3]